MEIQLYPYENDLNALQLESKKRNRNFDVNNIKINVNDSGLMSFSINSNIKHIKRLNLFLYTPGELGIKGNAVEIKNIIFD